MTKKNNYKKKNNLKRRVKFWRSMLSIRKLLLNKDSQIWTLEFIIKIMNIYIRKIIHLFSSFYAWKIINLSWKIIIERVCIVIWFEAFYLDDNKKIVGNFFFLLLWNTQMASNKNTMQSTSSSSTATNNAKNYNTLIDFAKFLRENGDKLFEKDSKLCIQTEQLLILQDYLQQITSYTSSSSNSSASDLLSRKQSSQIYTKEFLQLYKSNQLHLIQDFLYKITSLKIIAENPLNYSKDYLKLSIFGSLTYLEIKNCSINNINDLQNLRNQLEVLICIKCIGKVNDLLHLCGADQSSPFNWPKLHTLNLSYNQLNSIDSSFVSIIFSSSFFFLNKLRFQLKYNFSDSQAQSKILISATTTSKIVLVIFM